MHDTISTPQRNFSTEIADWCRPLPNGEGWQLLDPATQEPVGRDYTWVDQDERLLGGKVYLGRHGTQIGVELYLGIHAAGNDLRPDFEDRVRSADAYCFETYGWDRLRHIRRLNTLARTGELPDIHNAFRRRTLGAAMLLQPSKSFSDEPEDTHYPLDRFMIDHLRGWIPQRGAELSEEAALLWLSSRRLRESYNIAKFGHEAERLRLGMNSPARVVKTQGANHHDVTRGLRLMGVHVTPHVLCPQGTSPKAEVLGRVMRSGTVMRSDLAIIRARDLIRQ